VPELLAALLAGIRAVLGNALVRVFLRGSLASGDFNPAASDLDFFTVTERPASDAGFGALAVLHSPLATLLNRYGDPPEGPYLAATSPGRKFRARGTHGLSRRSLRAA
jgi:hypothetical protein